MQDGPTDAELTSAQWLWAYCLLRAQRSDRAFRRTDLPVHAAAAIAFTEVLHLVAQEFPGARAGAIAALNVDAHRLAAAHQEQLGRAYGMEVAPHLAAEWWASLVIEDADDRVPLERDLDRYAPVAPVDRHDVADVHGQIVSTAVGPGAQS